MEAVLHDIGEVQKMAEDLAGGEGLDLARYEADCEVFLGRIEAYVAENCGENYDYLMAKVEEVRAQLAYLLRAGGSGEATRSAVVAVQALNGIYRSIRNPVVGEADAEDYE